MASSQIEIASAPYEHVLRDHNRRMRERERDCSSKARMAFQKNIDELVRDHLSSCWGEKEVESEAMRRRQTRKLDRWAANQAKEMMTSIDRQSNDSELLALSDSHNVSERSSTFLRESSPSQSESSVDVPNLRASSLVQMWKEFEAEAMTPRGNQCGSLTSNSTTTRYTRMNSTVSNSSSVGESPMDSEIDDRFGTSEPPEDTFMGDWESEQHLTSRQNSDVSEKVRVADIVKRLTSGNPVTQISINSSSSNENENEHEHPTVPTARETPLSDHSVSVSVSEQGERRNRKLTRKRVSESEHDHPTVPSVRGGPSVSDPSVSGQGERRDLRKRLWVRGREATKDLLMQMEQERRRELSKLAERHSVSSFPHRGRIQSMLKLRFLRREGVCQDQLCPASRRIELDQLHERSTICLLRERFNMKAKKDENAPLLNEDNLQTCKKSPTIVQGSGSVPILDDINLQTLKLRNASKASSSAQVLNVDSGNAPELNDVSLQAHTELLNATQGPCNSGVLDHPTSEEVHHVEITDTIMVDQSSPSAQGSGNIPVPDEDNLKDHIQLLDPAQDLANSNIFDHLISQDGCHVDITAFEHSAETVRLADSLPSTSEYIQETSDIIEQGLCIDNLDSADVIQEESQLDTMQHIRSFNRWEMLTGEPGSSAIHLTESAESSWHFDLSYPPTDWESRRQTWYNEWLENDSENEEIHGVFERRTVSNLLSGTFRDTMERMIFSHIRSHPEIFEGDQDGTIGHQYQEASVDPGLADSPSSQLPLPSCLRLWSPDHESSDDSTRVAYTSQQPPQPSSSDYQDSQQCSPFTTHQSIEMELIYDLKGQMERLQDEMSELREFIKTCMGMQVQLQKSIKQEVTDVVCRSMTAVQAGKAAESSSKLPKKNGNCCICCSTQVDSLLYRCGHMCTCFKCAHELRCSSSRCPICRAPIQDVVRAYSDI